MLEEKINEETIVKKKKDNDLESLSIYKTYMDLIFYTEMILEKYPKKYYDYVSLIRRTTYRGMENILYAHKSYDKEDKLKYLNMIDANLKMLKVYLRLSHKKKIISTSNLNAWSKKLYEVGKRLGGWIKVCVNR